VLHEPQGRLLDNAPMELRWRRRGIVCRLDFTREIETAAFASITHLRFNPRLLLARDIAAYQKHRVKRLRHQAS
jgi:hypothetical protein